PVQCFNFFHGRDGLFRYSFDMRRVGGWPVVMWVEVADWSVVKGPYDGPDPTKFLPSKTIWFWRAIAVNVAVSLLILFPAVFFCEWWMRRKRLASNPKSK